MTSSIFPPGAACGTSWAAWTRPGPATIAKTSAAPAPDFRSDRPRIPFPLGIFQEGPRHVRTPDDADETKLSELVPLQRGKSGEIGAASPFLYFEERKERIPFAGRGAQRD